MIRNKQLDFLRFCGVFLVMMNHIHIIGSSILDKIFAHISVGGWIGVDLFFVLSGYLVSGLIFKEYTRYQSFSAGNFLIRRGFKIYPTYYFFLGISFLFYNYFSTERFSLAGLFHEGIFLSNYLSYNNIHLWSICIEEHFYLLLALVFLVLIRFKSVKFQSFLLIYVILLVFGLACRLYNFLHYTDYNFDRDYAMSHYRFDALFFGVLLAYVAQYRKVTTMHLLSGKFRWAAVLFSVLFLSSNFLFLRADHRWISVLNLALNPICFGYLMLCIINYQQALFLQIIAPLAYIGKYSYSIYLFHKVFEVVAGQLAGNRAVLYYICYFFICHNWWRGDQ